MMKPPNYYLRKDIEAARVIEAFELTWNLGNAVAYLLRAGKKTPDPLEDLKKARNHLDREIARLEGTELVELQVKTYGLAVRRADLEKVRSFIKEVSPNVPVGYWAQSDVVISLLDAMLGGGKP